MLQCKDCAHFSRDDKGRMRLTCDPFGSVIEPECLAKWQLIKTEQMVQAYQATLGFYSRLAPMQEKMFRAMEREFDDINEADAWKQPDDPGAPPGPDDDAPGPLWP